jgi:hypothetical protein
VEGAYNMKGDMRHAYTVVEKPDGKTLWECPGADGRIILKQVCEVWTAISWIWMELWSIW